MGCW